MTKEETIDMLKGVVTLRESGDALIGRCPFHKEKTGSFTIHPKKEIYHCFGCGRGGSLRVLLSHIWEHRDNVGGYRW